ncbi:hypothetical protein QBC34DRAFT_497170 [Podospora aff. communis PSN243]|uniref:Transmembrane protein n=1 Tax=Podospora aff. communis PSN243 TaxID=3040156 RepID=A0AAV9GC31_9PEZI|nr:hypothetical protein QBC34DRAFT_497170 [Podospora aff. communis PSN243]
MSTMISLFAARSTLRGLGTRHVTLPNRMTRARHGSMFEKGPESADAAAEELTPGLKALAMGVGAFIAVSSTYGMVVLWRRKNRAKDVLSVLENEARDVKEEEETFRFLLEDLEEESEHVPVATAKGVGEAREIVVNLRPHGLSDTETIFAKV